MAFTKNGDPSDTKFAMIDRTVAHLVRSIGKNAHTDIEFKEHMAKPEQQKKLTQFRIFVCLVGATKLCIKGVPSFHPNFALANKIYDHLDNNMVVGEYNLPRRSARKSLKREEVSTPPPFAHVAQTNPSLAHFQSRTCVRCAL